MWSAETKKEKDKAKKEIRECIAWYEEKEEIQNQQWKATEEFKILKERELWEAKEQRAAAVGRGEKIKTKQSWWGKKFKIKKLKRKMRRGWTPGGM